ncbi:Uncharacterized protein APZ42_031170 [Daphnia magna]|uniref:Reelin n=1 Tax=Daphnia magna TaxID=35525 RepID=A0A164N301_9CRUS|nr:Uncharacterized protein APZ42_031170 [Daphnia magna]
MRILDLTNCTRLRLWQPVHAGEGLDTWAIDGLVLHSTTPLGVILTSDFQQLNDQGSSWLSWFGGQLHSFCSRDDALVFQGELGEQLVFTGDSMITSETVLQFEVNVGCGTTDLSLEHPVRLEYSIDGGQNWHLVVKCC